MIPTQSLCGNHTVRVCRRLAVRGKSLATPGHQTHSTAGHPRMALSVSEKSVSEKSVSEKSVSEKSVPEKSVYEKSASEKSVSEK